VLRRRPRREQPESIVALIDVVFFLLVFFMLVGRMDATAPFEVRLPIATTGSDLPYGGANIFVGPSGRLTFDGVEIDLDALEDRVARRLADAPDTLLRIQSDAATQLRFVLPLVSELDALGAERVVFTVTPNPP